MTKQNFVVLMASLGIASLGFGQRLKLSPDFDGRDPQAQVKVIIQYKQAPTQSHIDAVVRRGGRHLGTLGVVNGAVYSVAAQALPELANDPDVAYISPDHQVKATSSQYSPLPSDYKLQ